MRLNDAYPSKYLKSDSAEVPEEGDTIFTIDRVQMERLGRDGDAEDKPVCYFQETELGLVVNKTNWQLISRALGSSDSDDWVGRQIALYCTDVQFGNEMRRGIRVRSKAPSPPHKPVPQPTGNPAPGPNRAQRRATAPAPGPGRTREPGDDDEDIPFASPFVDDFDSLP